MGRLALECFACHGRPCADPHRLRTTITTTTTTINRTELGAMMVAALLPATSIGAAALVLLLVACVVVLTKTRVRHFYPNGTHVFAGLIA